MKIYFLLIIVFSQGANCLAQQDANILERDTLRLKALETLVKPLETSYSKLIKSYGQLESGDGRFRVKPIYYFDNRFLLYDSLVVSILDSVGLNRIAKNSIIKLPNISFKPGERFLENEGFGDLEKLKELLLKRPTLKLEIRGHICCKMNGEDGFDPLTGKMNLSAERARLVKSYLVEHGISSSRVRSKGYGSSQKLFVHDVLFHSASKLNRRIDVKVIEE
jgi:outer membrane protein OmpA-like peptidoglycan-associated protein